MSLGLSKDTVGVVRGTVGLAATFAGVAAGGLLSLRFGYMRALLVGGVMQALGIAAFALLTCRRRRRAAVHRHHVL